MPSRVSAVGATLTTLATFAESDQFTGIELPGDDRLRLSAIFIEAAMKDGTRAAVQQACAEFLRPSQ